MMDIWISVFYVLCHFFAMSAGVLFLHCFFDTGFRWNGKKMWFILISSLLQGATNLIPRRMLFLDFLPIALAVLEMIVLTWDYNGKRFTGFKRLLLYWFGAEAVTTIYSGVVYSCLLPDRSTDLLEIDPSMLEADYTVFDFWQETPSEPILIINILGAVLFCCFFFLLYRLYRKNVVMQCHKKEVGLLLAFGAIGYSLSFVVSFFGDSNRVLLYTLAIVTILLAALIPVFIFSSRVGQYYRERTIYQENYMQEELAHFTQYKLAQEETARFRHDIRNNLLCLNELLQSDDTEKAKAYLRDLLDVSDTLRAKFVSGDEMLDCIIGVKAGIMEEKQIRFQLDGVLAGGLQWKPVDVCVVFANALDNAIEACTQLPPEDRSIDMRIKSTSLFWLVSITNPVKDAVDTEKLFQKNSGYTSKADAGHHGIGTYNMKNTVENYGGMLKADCREGLFTLEIAIDKSGNHTDIAP